MTDGAFALRVVVTRLRRVARTAQRAVGHEQGHDGGRVARVAAGVRFDRRGVRAGGQVDRVARCAGARRPMVILVT